MKTAWKDGERSRSVQLDALGGGKFRVRVDDAEFVVEAEALEEGRLRLRSDGIETLAEVTAAGARRFVRLGTADFVVEREAASRGRAGAQSPGLTAPMPGVVTRVLAKAGDDVTKGQPLLALEAMKMEHLIRAPRDGKVKSVSAQVGAMVQSGAVLAELEE